MSEYIPRDFAQKLGTDDSRTIRLAYRRFREIKECHDKYVSYHGSGGFQEPYHTTYRNGRRSKILRLLTEAQIVESWISEDIMYYKPFTEQPPFYAYRVLPPD